jgi:hypothetical protein
VSRRRSTAAAVVTLAACGVLASCAGTQDAAAAAAATDLLEAIGRDDGAAACALLAPAVRTELEDTSGTPCERAILEEQLGDAAGPVEVEVFDTTAQALVGPETLFLSRFDGQWLVIAAACTPVPDAPYDCKVGMP